MQKGKGKKPTIYIPHERLSQLLVINVYFDSHRYELLGAYVGVADFTWSVEGEEALARLGKWGEEKNVRNRNRKERSERSELQ